MWIQLNFSFVNITFFPTSFVVLSDSNVYFYLIYSLLSTNPGRRENPEFIEVRREKPNINKNLFN